MAGVRINVAIPALTPINLVPRPFALRALLILEAVVRVVLHPPANPGAMACTTTPQPALRK